MKTQWLAEKVIEVDDEGFLVDRDAWTPEVAEAIAVDEGLLPLTDEQWTVIVVARDKASEDGIAPMLRTLAAATGRTREQLIALFGSSHPVRKIARIAGLRRAASCSCDHAPEINT